MAPFNKNLEMIERYRPELLPLLKHPISTSHLTIVPTKSGAAQLLVKRPSGETLALHDQDNPLIPIQHTAAQISQTLKGVTVMLGFELGYLAKLLCHRLPENTAIIFYEADPAIFLMALNIVDLSDVLSHPRVAIHIGPEVSLQKSCATFLDRYGGPLQTTAYGPSLQVAPSLYEEKIHRELSQVSPILNSEQQVVEWDGTLLTENVMENLPQVIQTPSAASLHNAFEGIPAILVAAGPSLEKNVKHLQTAKGQTIIIAADTALKYLLAQEVIPNIVVSVDPHPGTIQKYSDVTIPEAVTLLFHPATNHQVVNTFPGPKLTMEISLPPYEWLQHHWAPQQRFDHEATCQIQVGFNFAAWMGCNPLVLVGHDLCFTNGRLHVPSGGYLSQENEARMANQGTSVTDRDGKPVKTNPTLTFDKRVLEKKIRDYSGTVINATEGGLLIEGAMSSPLVDVLTTYKHRESLDWLSAIQCLHERHTVPDWSALRRDTRNRLRDVFQIERTAQQVCQLLHEMKEYGQESLDSNPNLLKLSEQVEQLTKEMPLYTQAQSLLCGMNHHIRKHLQQDTNAFEQETDPMVKTERQIHRGLRYYNGLLEVAPHLRQMLARLLGRLKIEQQSRETVGNTDSQKMVAS